MPSKVRDKERDRDTETPRSKDKPRHRSSRSSRKSSSKDQGKTLATPERSFSQSPPPQAKRKSSLPIPELERRVSSNSPNASKTSLPYPSFSKAHSKEAIGSRENVSNPRPLSYYTPDPTDLDKSKDSNGDVEVPMSTGEAPPSPPETTMEQRPKTHASKFERPKADRKKTDLQKAAEELKRRLGRGGSDIVSDRKSDRHSQTSKSRTSQRDSVNEGDRSTPSSKRSKPSTPSKLKPRPVTVEDSFSTTDLQKSASPNESSVTETETLTTSTIDSDATSIAPNQPNLQQPGLSHVDGDSTTDPDSSPRTPTLTEPQFPPSRKETPAYISDGIMGYTGPYQQSPMPPPPPPPPMMPYQAPKVDYLMLNGGLSQSIPRTLLGAGQPVQTLQTVPPPVAVQVNRFFAPFNNLLEDYTSVISRNGSLAVATGYRSIARRLLDRLEAVFARDISSEICACIVCESKPITSDVEDERGVSWGEILEYVCGRQELPPWPAFTLDSSQLGLGICVEEHKPPMQKLDIDVPEEFRDHYVRQSKKTKQSVDHWLASQPDNPTSPPQDIDDETLVFAMLTRLLPEQRPLFSQLLGVAPSRPASRASTPLIAPRSNLLESTGLAIQRLYRLGTVPRDPESAMYLLTNPPLHNILATLAAISDGEWEILTSGRFDGFLRSGADDTTPIHPISHQPSRGPTPATVPSRGTTPFTRGTTPFSRGPTPAPASVGAPVAMDEETEIAVLAEVEREIYLGMEALEDAFEALHCKAETVRHQLRERGAGLSMANQARRGGCNLDARLGTPASGIGGGVGWDSETDDGIDDGMSEIVPDDSASNVSRSRMRRPKRRNERRTPALVEEEEEVSETVGSRR